MPESIPTLSSTTLKAVQAIKKVEQSKNKGSILEEKLEQITDAVAVKADVKVIETCDELAQTTLDIRV